MNKLININILLLIFAMVVFSSCAGTHKRLSDSDKTAAELNAVKVESTPKPVSETAIKEVEEKLVPNNEILPDNHRYFVIIGSFRNSGNAVKYQVQLKNDGFSSEILKNEAGLYRVSVLATDDIEIAREDITRIRKSFPEYFDTWLLIQMK